MPVLSGPNWVANFPGSNQVTALANPFRDSTARFVDAMRNAGCNVIISATLRPPERAFLMRFSTAIARGDMEPGQVPVNPLIDIDWIHRKPDGSPDDAKSRSAAILMRDGYGISPTSPLPALASRHTEGHAIDMTISWAGALTIAEAGGGNRAIANGPRSGLNTELIEVGAGYGVIKAVFKDDPHWSVDGH